MLRRVPREIMQRAIPFLARMAQTSLDEGRPDEALTYFERLIEAEPGEAKWRVERDKLLAKPEPPQEPVLEQMLEDPAAANERLEIERPPLPDIHFEPALLTDPSLPCDAGAAMVDGVKHLLWRYSALQSPKNALMRIEDPVWLDAWDKALAATAGSKVLFHGSELGTFALQARKQGAESVAVLEPYPSAARIAAGIIHKHHIAAWHAQHAVELTSLTEEDKQASFDTFSRHVQVLADDAEQLRQNACEWFVFPDIDHTLLGTGIVAALRRHRDQALVPNARILPGKARIFAMGISWCYPGVAFDLEPLNQCRWSAYPQAEELGSEQWTALTEAVEVAEIDFARFAESVREITLPVCRAGTLAAILFWFELDLAGVPLSNAPDSPLRCIEPAVQYTDAMSLEAGELLAIKLHLHETRLHFETRPAANLPRATLLPSWYVPMIADQIRNCAYQTALDNALRATSQTVLDIGAGCALLSMMASSAGARHVYGCEVNPAIYRIGQQVVERNLCTEHISLINQDCRKMQLPADLPQKADLAVFELFDCSLIGEGVLHFLAYAREHLLKENARYVPMSARIRAAVIEYRLDRVWDIDVNLLNPFRFSRSFINVDARELQYRALSAPFDVFAFDFASATPAAAEKDIPVTAIAAGTAGALLFWFELQLDEHSWLSNDPLHGQRLHWKQALQFMPEVTVTEGLSLPVCAKHDGSSLQFRWKQDGLPAELYSKLPRFDPRSWQQGAELDSHMRNLMQHCISHAAEYAKVAELAKRFAVDPASHGIDPKIAQRFLATFLGAH
jgi:hypothetical protein